MLLSTRLGMACRFDQNDDQIRPMGRTARGVTGMRFKIPGDDLVSMEIIHENLGGEVAAEEEEIVENTETAEAAEVTGNGPEILVVTDGGMGKRSYVATYRKTNRGAKGVSSIRLREGETVIAALQIVNSDELLMTTAEGQLVRIPASEIRTIGRNSVGVRIMNLKESDRITGVAKLVEVEAEKKDASAETSAEGTVPAGVPAPAAPEVTEDGAGNDGDGE